MTSSDFLEAAKEIELESRTEAELEAPDAANILKELDISSIGGPRIDSSH